LYLVVLFFPKENLYYYFEGKLEKYNVIFDNESISDNLGVLSVEGIDAYYGGENAAKIDKISLLPFIVYNEIKVERLNAAKKLQSFIPSQIDKASFKSTAFFPVKIWIDLEGNFGKIYGSYNIYNKKIRLILEPENDFAKKNPFIYSNFKDVEGRLIYESYF
jgi:hypothetical protein